MVSEPIFGWAVIAMANAVGRVQQAGCELGKRNDMSSSLFGRFRASHCTWLLRGCMLGPVIGKGSERGCIPFIMCG